MVSNLARDDCAEGSGGSPELESIKHYIILKSLQAQGYTPSCDHSFGHFTMELNVFLGSAFLAFLYCLWGIVYRLYLSPIANIPGPRLAAITWWFEYYYDVIFYGKYIFKIRDLHKEYGPIVRINPYEVHISDPDFYDTLYSASNSIRKERWSWYAAGLGIPTSTLATVEQGLHRRRRAAMSPFFSKQNVRKLQPVINERASKLRMRLEQLVGSDEIVPINLAFSAFTNGRRFPQCC